MDIVEWFLFIIGVGLIGFYLVIIDNFLLNISGIVKFFAYINAVLFVYIFTTLWAYEDKLRNSTTKYDEEEK